MKIKEDIEKPIGLVDLDGTYLNYMGAIRRDLDKLRSPFEPLTETLIPHKEPDYIKARMDMIRSSSEWWENLEPLKTGIEMVNLLHNIGFRVVVCTQGPKKNAEAWKGKLLCCLKTFLSLKTIQIL